MVDFTPSRGHEQEGVRPAVIVSTDDLNEVSDTCIVVALTGHRYDYERPQHVKVRVRIAPAPPIDGTIKVDQLLTIDTGRLGDFKGRLPDAKMLELDAALFWVMGLDDGPAEVPGITRPSGD